MRAAPLLLAAAFIGAAGCRTPHATVVDSQPRRAGRLVHAERREAIAPRDARDAVRFDAPRGATRARFSAAAWGTSWRSRFGAGEGECLVRVLPSGATTPLRLARADSESDARWTDVEADAHGESLELSCPWMPRGAELWWSRPVFAPAGTRRSVLLVSIDTVRADAALRAPRLQALAADGTRFTQAFSAAPWTLPSHVSVMTGLHPSWHGRWDPKTRDHELPFVATLASVFAANGWETAAFTGQGSISWTLGATRDFGLVVEHPATEPGGPRECDVSEADAESFIRSLPRSQPFFVFWHVYEPHSPYVDRRFDGARLPLPPGVAEDARRDWQRYLGDLAAADDALGRMLESLRDRDDVDVVVMSDHGEDFGEHSDGVRDDATRHGNGLWDTQLHVPLVIRAALMPRGVRDDIVSLVDLFPTILELAGLVAPSSQGRSLLAPPSRESIAAEALYPGYAPHEMKAWREATGLEHVSVLSSPPQERLFDSAADPLQLRDVSADRPDDVRRLHDAAAAFWREAPSETAVRVRSRDGEIPPELLESLKALGYVR